MAYSPNRIKIDLSSVEHNLLQVKRLIPAGTKVMGIVKSDAYGHGLLEVSRALAKNGVHSLGVAHLHEALKLRDEGLKLPIVILCGITSRQDFREVVEKDLTPVIFDLPSAGLLAEEAARKDRVVNMQLKIDTGMGRLGIPHSEAGPFMKQIMGFTSLKLEALMSHLSSADEPDAVFTEDQIQKFKGAIDAGRSLGLDLPLNNLANSAGIMGHRESHFNMVRPGIMLYGGLPSPEFRPPSSLKPVMQFKGVVVQTRELPDQTPVSYDRTYYTKGAKRVAILSAGYGDGLFRSLSNRGQVLIGGHKSRILGRVCMNMIVCDITGIRNVTPGNEVVFLGAQGDEAITADEMASWCDTISYEIFLSIGRGAVREYVR